MASFNGRLFFTATTPGAGAELWSSDGTAAGTTMVADLDSGRDGSYPNEMIAAFGTLYFVADDGVHGRELWSLAPPPSPTPPASPEPAAAPTSAPPRRHAGTATAARVALVKGGRAQLKLTCHGPRSCRGTVKLTYSNQGAKHHGSGGHRARRELARRGRRGGAIKLGAGRFVIGAGKQRTVAVKLGRQAKKMLRRSGRRGLRARLGGSGIKHGAVLLKPAS
jgi:ELWxxDGT repeat protein